MPRRVKYSNGGSIDTHKRGITAAYNKLANVTGSATVSGGSQKSTHYGVRVGTKDLQLRATGSSLNIVPTSIGFKKTIRANTEGTWDIDAAVNPSSLKNTASVKASRTTRRFGKVSAKVSREPKPFGGGRETVYGITYKKRL